MKQLLTIALVAFLVSGCRKEAGFSEVDIRTRIRSVVTDSIGNSAAATFNFTSIMQVTLSNDSVYYLVRSNKDPHEFIALWMNRQGNLQKGVQVALNRRTEKQQEHLPFDGTVTIKHLSGALVLQTDVRKGCFVKRRLHKPNTLYGLASISEVVPVEPDPYKQLSEVIVVATRSSGGGYNYATWMNITAMFDAGPGAGYYTPVGGADAGAGAPSGQEGVYSTDPIKVDEELGVYDPAIDVNKYLACFDKLPDAGATCSIEILTDIPVDNDPNRLVDWQSGSAGHTFLQFRKQVGGQIIVQNIGFYPVNSWKVSFTNAPVPGKFVDNGNHEYNASLQMPVSPEQFRQALNELRYLARSSTYDLDEFNCTDLAVRVFNTARVQKLDIPLYDIPGGMTVAGTSTPQGVYHQLRAMKASGVEASHISIPGVKGYVASSDGPCN